MISKKKIENIAKLSRIKISAKEVEKFGSQISSILKFTEKLNEIDTEKIKVNKSISGLSNVWREDKVEKSEIEREKFLENAAGQKDGFIKTKAVFEE